MGALEIPENVGAYGDALCLTFAFLAGFVQGFLGCLLAWVAKRKVAYVGEDGESTAIPAWLHQLNVAGVVASATLPGILSIGALAFGAISMVVVVRSSSILVFNVVFTRAFGLGSVKKNDAVGTALCVLGVVALYKVAPTDRTVTDLDYVFLLTTPVAISWNTTLVVVCASSALAVWASERRRQATIGATSAADGGSSASDRVGKRKAMANAGRNRFARAAFVSVVVATASAAMDLSAKGYTGSIGNTASAFLGSAIFWISLMVFAVSAVVMRGYYVYGCKACDVLVFIPLNTMLTILMSAATGFAVMEEWRTVEDWDAFFASYLVIFLGVYLLCTKEARDRVSLRSGEASATLLQVQQLCADMYTAPDKAIAIQKFEQLVQKAIQLGEVRAPG